MSNKQLLSRYERKFSVPGLSVYDVERIIKTNLLCFREVFYPRYINNIYLDTFDRKSWHENVVGDTHRIKARIRWYGELLGQVESPYLEFKVKDGLLGRKPSYTLPNFIFDSSISKTILHELFHTADLKEEILHHMLRLEPTLVNRYKRKYFLSQNKKFRLTVDTELSYYKINTSYNNFNRAYNDKDKVIIEIKYDKEDDDNVDEISNSFPFRLTKKSKYVSGIYSTVY
ncbi:VTC domain-containing protein [Candidatus Babeliales bacterium]|nr:VTC domain-containing protein [Candidatus Babeliales bacterium]